MKFLICGFGHAGNAYAQAIHSILAEHQVFIFDLNPVVEIPAWANRVDDINTPEYDIGIVATPPASHLKTLEAIVNNCQKVIIEKPLATNKEEHKEILRLAESGVVYFSLHAYFGKEMQLVTNVDSFEVSNAFSISHFFSDRYGNAKANLGGPFWDSIYNVISIFHRITSGQFDLKSCNVVINNEKCFSAKCEYLGADSNIINQTINIHWNKGLNLKVSQISQRDLCFTFNHSSQSLNNANGQVNLTIPFEIERLAEHYRSVVCEVIESQNNIDSLERVKSISEVVWALFDKPL